MDYKPRLRGIARAILSLLAQVLTIFVERIKDVEVKLMARGLVEAAGKTVEVLADANPDDADQLRGILNDLLKDGPFKEGSRAEIQSRIQRINDPDVRVLLTNVLIEAYPVLDLLTDEEGGNATQIKAHLRELLQTDQGMLLFRSLFGIVLPDDIANTAALIIVNLIITELEENGNDPVVLRNLRDLETTYQKALVKAA